MREWIGGRFRLPAYVMEEAPFRPEILLWVESPEALIVASRVVDPAAPVSLGECLKAAISAPMFGPSRRPDCVRVATPALAMEIREAVDDMDVRVAPTPELDEVLAELAASMKGDVPETWLEGGSIPEDAIEALFRGAETLWTIAPWKMADDGHVLRVDVPALGVEGACLSILGALGEAFGFILFPSFEGYEAFVDGAETRGAASPDFGEGFLALDYMRGADLPDTMRREIVEHGWPVADAKAYPWVQRRDPDGAIAPTTETDIHLVAAVASSLASFFAKHGEAFGDDLPEPVSESWFDADGFEVRFTVPYHAFSLFEPAPESEPPPRIARRKVARNAPCPCGSGRKYKKCCLQKDEARSRAEAPPPESERLHAVDTRLVGELDAYGVERFGNAFLEVVEDFYDPEETLQLLAPWSVYGFAVKGRPVVEWFLEELGGRIAKSERRWLEAQCASWLGIWEVLETTPGRAVRVRELLSGEERTVTESRASSTLQARDAVLARVVDHEGLSLFCGLHPRSLMPFHAARVLEQARRRLRRKRTVPVERLRDARFGRFLIRSWEEAVDEADEIRKTPPRLSNRDGDPLRLTVDRFEFDPSDRERITDRLEWIEGFEPSDEEAGALSFTLFGPEEPDTPDHTIIGFLRVEGDRMELETNSLRRADDLRGKIEAACGDDLRHRERQETDPREVLSSRPRAEPPEPSLQGPDVDRIVREQKECHYASWVDIPIPALDGQTPAQAIRSKTGRERVDLLLRDIENLEARMPEGQRYDVALLRARLGL